MICSQDIPFCLETLDICGATSAYVTVFFPTIVISAYVTVFFPTIVISAYVTVFFPTVVISAYVTVFFPTIVISAYVTVFFPTVVISAYVTVFFPTIVISAYVTVFFPTTDAVTPCQDGRCMLGVLCLLAIWDMNVRVSEVRAMEHRPALTRTRFIRSSERVV